MCALESPSGLPLHSDSDLLKPLREWAGSDKAEKDLESIFGDRLDWVAAYRWLGDFRRGDFSSLPPVQILPASAMPGLWGGYSRERKAIFLSQACPPEYVAEALIEEIGHFLDQELCQLETPGDEGTLFARAVLGTLDHGDLAEDLPEAAVDFEGARILVEAMGARVVQTSPNQILRGTAGNDTFVIFDANVEIQDFLPSIDWIEASTSIDLTRFTTTENILLTGSSNLSGKGNSQNNLIIGNAGNNFLDGGSGNDTLVALSGNNFLISSSGNNSMVGGSGNDTLVAGLGRDTLFAGDGQNYLYGAAGAHSLQSGSGNDTLVAGFFGGTLNGGAGDDAYFIRSLSTVILETGNGGNDTIFTTNRDIKLGTYANIEHVIYIEESDWPLAPESPPIPSPGLLIIGDSLNNYLTGTSGDDTIRGLAGNDTLDGRGGYDILEGGSGNDLYILENSVTQVVELAGEGIDTVRSGVSYTLPNHVEVLELSGFKNLTGTGNSLDNSLFGNFGNNTLSGVSGNNYFNGRGGINSLVGGTGNDTYFINNLEDKVSDSGGLDWIFTSLPDFSLLTYGQIEHLAFFGATGASLSGNSLANSILGGNFSDTLIGSSSGLADTFIGGWGDDVYIVGKQSDVIVETADPNGGIDTIITTAPVYSMASFANVEILRYTGSSNSTLTGNSGDNTILGGLAIRNTANGGDGDDYIVGGNTSDSLVGGAGNDTLVVTSWVDANPGMLGTALNPSHTGNDTLVGGAGNDWYVVDHATRHRIIEDPDPAIGGIDTIASTVSFSLNISGLSNSIENLFLIGSANLTGTGNSLDNVLTGNDGNNTLRGGAGNDTIYGGLGSDLIHGDAGDDVLVGGGSSQGDLPGDASTPVTIRPGQKYEGTFELDPLADKATSTDVDWIRAELEAGVEYIFELSANFFGGSIEKNESVLQMLAPTRASENSIDGIALFAVGPKNATISEDRFSRSSGVLLRVNDSSNQSIYLKVYLYSPGEIYIPVSSTGPVTGTYELKLPDGDNPISQIISDNARNTLVGGLGRDSIVAGNGRDAEGNPIGDFLFGGTNGVPGGVDTDTTGAIIQVNTAAARFAFGLSDTLVSGADGSIHAMAGDTLVSALGGGLFQYTIFVNPGETFNYPGGSSLLAAGAEHFDVGSLRFTADTRALLANESLLGGSSRQVSNATGAAFTIHRIAADTLIGGNGADLLDGGRGKDSLAGGKGNDTYYIDDLGSFIPGTPIRNAGDRIFEADDGGSDDLVIANSAAAPFRNFQADLAAGNFEFANPALGLDSVTGWGFDVDLANVFRNVEHASLMGSGSLYILGNSDSNSLFGNFGNNLLVGGDGNDTLMGMAGSNYLVGGEGSDWLDGGNGPSTLVGGVGSDTYVINNRDDRIMLEQPGLDGGEDTVRTRFNFDPMQGTAAFDPYIPDNSPSVTKSPSFASLDLESFYNLEHFVLLDQAAYGVGNAQNNSMTASDGAAALLLGMGGDDTLLGGALNDSLFGDTPRFYAKPDLFAPAPTDTRTQAFLDGVVGQYGNDYLDGGDGNDYLDGGRGFDTMIGGSGNDTFIQDHVDDYIVATGGGLDELITSVNIAQAPNGINDIMLVVKDQDRDANGQSITGQEQVASFASFLGSEGGNQVTYNYGIGTVSVSVEDANRLELMYSYNDGDTYRSTRTEATHRRLNVGLQQVDFNDNTKVAHELSWSAGRYDANAVVGYTVRYRQLTDANGNPFVDTDGNPGIWKTYLDGTAQDLRGTQSFPSLRVDNLNAGDYEFEVVSNRLAMPVERYFDASDLDPGANPANFTIGQALREQVVTLQGGGGNDFITAQKLVYDLPGGLADDAYTDPLVLNNPLNPLPFGFIFAPEPVNPNVARQAAFAAYLDGGAGNDLLVSARVNGGLGVDYVFQGITFSGLNTMVGGQGSDTFVVKNGGQAFGDTFDHVIKYGNETPVDFGAGGVGASLNGGQHNLVVSNVPFLTLSDTIVSQGKYIDQVVASSAGQFVMGNRLDNFIADGLNGGGGSGNTLVGGIGRDSIQGGAVRDDVLIGGTAYGVDNVGLAIKDFASVADGGNGLTTSIFRDTDPIPVNPNGPAFADPSQFWFVPGLYGGVLDPNRNRDTLVAADASTLDGGAGHDSLVGSSTPNSRGDNFFVSGSYDLSLYPKFIEYILGGTQSQNINAQDAVIGNGGNDTVTFTDSDRLWWVGYAEGDILPKNGYRIAGDISNLVLQMGSPTARNGFGNRSSTGNENLGSNLLVGNEFDNILNGGGVGGQDQTGAGIDTLTGDGGFGGFLSADNFIIDADGNSYRNSTSNVWSPFIETTNFSAQITSPPDPVTGEQTSRVVPIFQHEVDYSKSEYRDFDFVVVRDFETVDTLTLGSNIANYSIGNIPTSLSSPGALVGPRGNEFTSREFGIYYTGDVWGTVTPNLVAVIQSTTDLLGPLVDADSNGLWDGFTARPVPDDLVVSGTVGPPEQGGSSVPPPLMGWGEFYDLSSTPFAANVNQPYVQSDSTASLSSLMNQIV